MMEEAVLERAKEAAAGMAEGAPAAREEEAHGKPERAARVVEIPMRWGPGSEEAEAAAKRCRHEGVSGRCAAEAVRDGFCGRHDYWEKLQPYGMAMVCPDDRAGVQEVLRRTLSLVLANLLTPQQALVIVAICRAMLKTM